MKRRRQKVLEIDCQQMTWVHGRKLVLKSSVPVCQVRYILSRDSSRAWPRNDLDGSENRGRMDRWVVSSVRRVVGGGCTLEFEEFSASGRA